MNKNNCAKTPPMGWNSWDCYGAAVTEEILKANADYMAEHLKEYGWEYIVCDIQWYESKAVSDMYNAFYPLEMDEYSRLIPAANRFPSSAGGKGFAPIAEYVHNLGLKFGIHIMRGIPRQAVHAASPIKGTDRTARDIAQQFSLCPWNTDMYGVNPRADGAQEYYNSLFELYAEWGVDFVKVDDICDTKFNRQNPYSAKYEIEMLRKAIDNCGREMVLSLSPGPAPVEHAQHLREHANMWRMTDDFWDNWEQLYAMFERCEVWSRYVSEGCWPDCDMLPIGKLRIMSPGHNQQAHYTNFTEDEQITMMTLWCIFRSPLMIGAEMRENDDFTLSILTNRDLLRLLSHSYDARQVQKTHDTVIWTAKDTDGGQYVAFFNTSNAVTQPSIPLARLRLNGKYEVYDLWKHEKCGIVDKRVSAQVNIHGAVIYKLEKII